MQNYEVSHFLRNNTFFQCHANFPECSLNLFSSSYKDLVVAKSIGHKAQSTQKYTQNHKDYTSYKAQCKLTWKQKPNLQPNWPFVRLANLIHCKIKVFHMQQFMYCAFDFRQELLICCFLVCFVPHFNSTTYGQSNVKPERLKISVLKIIDIYKA